MHMYKSIRKRTERTHPTQADRPVGTLGNEDKDKSIPLISQRQVLERISV